MTELGSRAEPPAEGAQGRLALRALGPAELARLRAEAARLLETRGVVVSGELARVSLADAGVALEKATGVARIPARLIEGALALGSTTPTLGGRVPKCDVVLGRAGLLATGGPAAELLSAGGELRPAGPGDLTDVCRLADGLPEVAVVAGPPLALARGGAGADAPREVGEAGCAVAEELQVCLTNTTKHVMLTAVESPAQAETVAAMAAAVAGDDEALRRRPPVSVVAPGLHPAGPAVDALLVCARRGLPVGFTFALRDAPGAAGSAPVTTTGEALAEAVGLGERLARQAASALAACAVVQLVAPGTTFIATLAEDALWPPSPDLADGPSAWSLALAYNELMSSFELPSLVVSTSVGAARPGWRSSVETTFAALISALGSPALLSGAGGLAGGRAFSPAQLVLDCESHAVCARIAQGIDVDEETVAQETIAAIGIGGNALAQRHTRRHLREVWRPRVFDRSSLEAWQREGRVGSERKAEELAARILAEHRVPPLEAEKAETLARIVATSGL